MAGRLDIVLAICTYNNARLLRRTLASIEMQEIEQCDEWSVMVVDNNCRDETGAVVEEFVKRKRIPSLRRIVECKQGLAFARQRAIKATSSDLIAFIDDDCSLDSQWVNQAVCFFSEHENAGALGGRIQVIWETHPPELLREYEASFPAQDYGSKPKSLTKEKEPDLAGAGLVLRRKGLLDSEWCERFCLVGRKGRALNAGDDTEIILRIRNAGYELWYTPSLNLKHFIPASRISVDYCCRLHRGFGRSYPFLLAHNMRLDLSPRSRVRVVKRVSAHVREFFHRVGLRWGLWSSCLPGDLRIQRNYFLGMLEGCASFLVRGHNP